MKKVYHGGDSPFPISMYTKRNMKISFVIPAYNEEALIGKCLESVERETASNTVETEIIVVDNASTDKTGDIARSFNHVRVVEEKRKGLTFARQAGFAASSGDIIANVDSDAMLPEGWLKTVAHEFARDPKLVALSGPHIYYDMNVFQRALVKIFYGGAYALYLINSLLGHGAMLQGGNFILRRSALVSVGGFDTTIEFHGEDTDIARRVARVGRVQWTFSLPIYASGRRLQKEGIVRTALTYTLNHLSILYRHKPYSPTHDDVRL